MNDLSRIFQLPVFFLGMRGLYNGALRCAFLHLVCSIRTHSRRQSSHLRAYTSLRSFDRYDHPSMRRCHIPNARNDSIDNSKEHRVRNVRAEVVVAVELYPVHDHTSHHGGGHGVPCARSCQGWSQGYRRGQVKVGWRVVPRRLVTNLCLISINVHQTLIVLGPFRRWLLQRIFSGLLSFFQHPALVFQSPKFPLGQLLLVFFLIFSRAF